MDGMLPILHLIPTFPGFSLSAALGHWEWGCGVDTNTHTHTQNYIQK